MSVGPSRAGAPHAEYQRPKVLRDIRAQMQKTPKRGAPGFLSSGSYQACRPRGGSSGGMGEPQTISLSTERQGCPVGDWGAERLP
jgi:hypothetical protein